MTQVLDLEKSPMDYLFTQNFQIDSDVSTPMSPAERIFMKKYMGLDTADGKIPTAPEDFALTPEEQKQAKNESATNYVEKMFNQEPESIQVQPEKALVSLDKAAENTAIKKPALIGELVSKTPARKEEVKRSSKEEVDAILAEAQVTSIIPELRAAEEVLMVGLFLQGQVFVIPVKAVLEVIQFLPLARVPRAPEFLLGVVNLRGRITPVIRLTDFVCAQNFEEDKHKGFFVICEYAGLQVGLHIDKVHTMYKAKQSSLTWEVENQLGTAAEFISGLFMDQDKLLGIISVENIVKKLLCDI